jgi:hypothetical protein
MKPGDKEAKDSIPALPAVEIEVERDVSVEVEGRKQFLGLNRYDWYGVHPDREKSDGLENQINHELQRLGYPKSTLPAFRSFILFLLVFSQVIKNSDDRS